MKIYYISLFAMVLSLSACQSADQAAAQDPETGLAINDTTIYLTPEQQSMAGLMVGVLERRIISGAVTCAGVVETPPQSRASVYAPISGYVKQVNGYPGTPVKKGDLLAIIEHPDIIRLQQEYLDAKAQLTYWTGEYNRLQQLVSGEVASQKQLEQATAQLANAKATVAAQEAQLTFMGIDPNQVSDQLSSGIRLLAPISGYITVINTHLGALASPEEALYEIVDDSHLHLELGVYTQDIGQVKAGQQVIFRLPNGREEYKGEVQLIGKQVDMDTKTIQVHVHFDEQSVTLTPGTFVTARILTAADSVTAVPETALIRKGDRHYVFVQVDDHFIQVAVQTGNSDNGFTAVDIPAPWQGKKLVLRGAYYVAGMMQEDDGGHDH